MHTLWRFLVYDAMPLMAVLVALAAAVKVLVSLGPETNVINRFLDSLAGGTSLRSMLRELRGIRPMAPEHGLVELADADGNNAEELIRLLGTAQAQFCDRMRRLDLWTSTSGYLTGILVLVTLMYVSDALHSFMVGLSLEITHNTTALLDVLHNVLVVLHRNAWVVFCLIVLHVATRLSISRRKERWGILATMVTQAAVKR